MAVSSITSRSPPRIASNFVTCCCLGLLFVCSASACSVYSEEGCNPTSPVAQTACEAGLVLRGSVIAGVDEESMYMRNNINVTVRVTEAINAGAAGDATVIPDDNQADVVISGFLPCCLCGTEAPAVSEDEYFFFVSADWKTDESSGNPVFSLSSTWLGSGKILATEGSFDSILMGIDAAHSGMSCDTLYCMENPTCVSEIMDKDCPSVLRG